tara:strand:+ start:41 stop:643 length:603 start_codon:yes stop_codon:yes gene_type:complete
MAEKKLEGKPRTVGAAKKAGSKFFYDKNGTKKLAVTAEELKKSGKTLTQWANDWKKPGSSTAVSKSLRPKKRPPSGGSVSAVTAKETAEVKAANLKIKADRAAKAKRLMEELKAKLKMQAANKEAADSKKKLKGADWMKANNFSDYMALSKSQARALGLPATRFVASQHNLREQKFKDGKGFFNGTERKVSTGRKPVPRR